MRRSKHPIHFLLLSIISFLGLAYLIFFFNPEAELRIMNYELEVIYLFFLLLITFLFLIFNFLLNNARQGVFIGLFLVAYLLLRFNHLANLFFLILLIILFLTLEFLFRKQ